MLLPVAAVDITLIDGPVKEEGWCDDSVVGVAIWLL
jgi:hypothetical protein